MSKPFSQDLRKRVVAAVESGTEPEKVAEIFQVHVTTVEKWIILKKETGSLEIKSGYQNGHSHKITDLEAFKKFVLANKNDSLEALAQKIGSVSDTTVGRAMKKIEFSKKKDIWIQGTK
jgi:transposase